MTLAVDVGHRLGSFGLTARFEAPAGLTVLFGPSGAGKTLTLRLVAGLTRPQQGRVAIDGTVLSDADSGIMVRARHRRVGMVFQEPLLLPHRSAARNVALAARDTDGDRLPRRDRHAAARSWLERVGAAELADRRPHQLSGGQQQRVALARALVGRPRMLLLDEPFSALDAPVRRRLRELVRTLVETEGLIALFVTHDREEAAELADHVVLARPGAITERHSGHHALAALGDRSGPTG
ncbi:ATP-binding cassette domain-containing protein [Egibacter rhizosphaerae]|uniref:ATP-binding cassette domain-containing protein n=1 Tax=Egibacter rhizosphaerae TaxID=1670831 RepID=A0A411YJ24_9ACTN|nr:ATP-binding cassette domain-containing protein [Egibacter rhizosphaerae]QBI21151.1 ATP-binding cassette domain-containing protein [Egibacter rhizosphaerae]